ncbi:MAG: Flp pilus assembly complex ATPase component TadA [Fibrobacteria bacterium]|nr:Flp pilus assembly complex ATPase component TadA [Fibrobacteria bacterium]
MDKEAQTKQPPINMGLFASAEKNAEHIRQILERTTLDRQLNLRVKNLEHCSKVRQNLNKALKTQEMQVLSKKTDVCAVCDCEIALAIFSLGDDVEKYALHLASLKLITKVNVVISLVMENAKELFENRQLEIVADNILQMPVWDADIAKVIKTAITTIRIEQSKKSKGAAFHRSPQSLGSILVENSIITALELKTALDHQKKTTGMLLGDALVALGYIDEHQKTRFLASQMGVPMAIPRQYASADVNVVSLVPEHIARAHMCLAVEKKEDILTVAMLDVNNIRVLDSLRDHTDCEIRPILGTKHEIGIAIERYYADITTQRDAADLMEDLEADVEILKTEAEDLDPEKAAAEGAELGIIKLVNMLFANAIRDRASDIHIEPGETDLQIRYRIDGELRRMMSPPKHSHQAITTRIKILSDLNIAERRLPQDGRMVVRIGKRQVDLRVSVLPTIHGEKVVMRILDKEAFKSSMNNLGFEAHEMKIFKDNIARPYGMVIVTGPTGSGKSTTLYSALESVKSIATNIITVEDPVEFHMEGINQVHVNSAIGLTFAAALRSILRQDPDTILIGEIRDGETADIAIKMALTGHMVFSTLHTNDASSAVTRFVDIGIPPLLLTSSLNLIIAQRLVRTICGNCKIEYIPEPEVLEQLNLSAEEKQHKFYKGEGCVACNGTGYKGRTGLFEMLQVTKEMRKLILKSASSQEIQDLAVQEGMKTLRQSGIEQMLAGNTTIEQVLAVTTLG